MTKSDIDDAMEMLGNGYDHNSQPSVIVEPPRRYTARRHGKMVEVDEPAWVKFSTEFKTELADLDEYSLKVFIYIGLSVDFNTGEAWPGVRKIAEDTGMNKDTVTKAVVSLEEKGFMAIHRREGSRNIYKPIRYISIGTVRPNRTVDLNKLSDENAELSDENEKLSGASRVDLHNKNNKKEQEEIDSGYAEIFKALSNLTGGGLNSNTPKFVDAWKERHTNEWILKAIQIAEENNARSIKYVDSVLIGWEANDYPKTREELVKERRGNGNGKNPAGKKNDVRAQNAIYDEMTPEQLAAARAEMKRLLMGDKA